MENNLQEKEKMNLQTDAVEDNKVGDNNEYWENYSASDCDVFECDLKNDNDDHKGRTLASFLNGFAVFVATICSFGGITIFLLSGTWVGFAICAGTIIGAIAFYAVLAGIATTITNSADAIELNEKILAELVKQNSTKENKPEEK